MTLYLSKIEVDFPTARRLALWDDYRWHQAAWQAFPDQPRKRREFLTRVDRAPNSFRAWLLSTEVPQPPTWGHWQYKRVADSFLSHVRYLFSLRANPTKKIVDPNRPKVIRPDGSIDRNKNAKRIPLLRLEELRAWIQRKGREQGGFVLDESQETGQPLVITKEPRHRLRIEGSGVAGGGNQLNRYQGVCLNSVLFEGVLVVTDHARFTETFLHGVGSAKGFGFGMLVLDPRPVSQLSTPNHPLVST